MAEISNKFLQTEDSTRNEKCRQSRAEKSVRRRKLEQTLEMEYSEVQENKWQVVNPESQYDWNGFMNLITTLSEFLL